VSPKHGDYRTIALTPKARLELERERRQRQHPELDPDKDWVEVPLWMLDGGQAARERASGQGAD